MKRTRPTVSILKRLIGDCWPFRWLQITPFLAWQDYWQTGQTDLMEAYADLLFNSESDPAQRCLGQQSCDRAPSFPV